VKSFSSKTTTFGGVYQNVFDFLDESDRFSGMRPFDAPHKREFSHAAFIVERPTPPSVLNSSCSQVGRR